MELILKENGYSSVTAQSYKTILPIIYKNKPDIIILDVMLENEDGRNICLQLKNTDRTKDICVILLSAFHEKLIGYKTFKASGILAKPFHDEDLLKVLETCDN